MRRVVGPDGTRWRIGRKRLPWRPRMIRARPILAELGELLMVGGEIFGLILMAIAIALVITPILIAFCIYLLEWIVVLAWMPFLALIHWIRRSHTVYAKSRHSFFQPIVAHGRQRPIESYRRRVSGWRESRRLLADVRREIVEAGSPDSLGEPIAWDRPTGTALIEAALRRSLPTPRIPVVESSRARS